MKKKILPWSKPKILSDDISNVTKALKTNWISGGININKFEINLKKFLKVKNICVTSNGTSAIHLAFISCGLKYGDEIIIPGYGYMAAANIAHLMGLKIKFAEVCSKTFCVKLESIKKIISKKTKLIVVIHTYGNIYEIDKICNFAKKKDVLVLEDCAESLGSKYKNKQCGTFGDLSTFSFHATKMITTGEGGAVATKHSKIYKNLNLFRSHGVKKKRYLHYVPGHNFRLTNFQCALGISQLKRINLIKKQRVKLFNIYKKHLEEKRFSVQKFDSNTEPNYWTLSILLSDEYSKKKRDKLISKLLHIGIETRNGFYCSNEITYFKKHNTLKNCITLSDRIINLPLYEDLSLKDIKYIVKNFLIYLNKI